MSAARQAYQAYAALIKGRRLLQSGGWRALTEALPPQPTGEAGGADAGAADVGAIAERCDRAARRLPLETKCLERSFAMCSVLRSHGIRSLFCVGVSRYPPMRFHAWVEVDDEVLNEPQPVHELYRTMCAL